MNVGDQVITVAAGFPTTFSPIIQVGAIPVFIDADLLRKCDMDMLESIMFLKDKGCNDSPCSGKSI